MLEEVPDEEFCGTVPVDSDEKTGLSGESHSGAGPIYPR